MYRLFYSKCKQITDYITLRGNKKWLKMFYTQERGVHINSHLDITFQPINLI